MYYHQERQELCHISCVSSRVYALVLVAQAHKAASAEVAGLPVVCVSQTLVVAMELPHDQAASAGEQQSPHINLMW